MVRLVLASGSPRRALLMREAGFDAEIIPPAVDEPQTDGGVGVSPVALAETLSYFKARSVELELACQEASDGAADGVSGGAVVVIGADTVVAYEGEIFGKPKDEVDARRILMRLSGTTHEVVTGVTFLDVAGDRQVITHSLTPVTMRRMSDVEMDRYLDSRAWEGKAGAYGIQDKGDAYVEHIGGSFSSVVGLPMEVVCDVLAGWGIKPRIAE